MAERTEDSSPGPVHKSAVANCITQGQYNRGSVSMYYGGRKRPTAEEIDTVKEKIASFQKIRKLEAISEAPAADEIDTVKEKIASSQKIRKLEAISEAMAEPKTKSSGASKYKRAPPPEQEEREARDYYFCMPSLTRHDMNEDVLQKASSSKYLSSTSRPSTKNCSLQGFSIDEDQLYQCSSPNRVQHVENMPIVENQVSPEKLPLAERAVPENLRQTAYETTSTDNLPTKPETKISQKASPVKNVTNISANDGSSRGPSFVTNDNSPKDQPQENHSTQNLL